MPKVGMEPVRRKEIIDATIAMIGERRSLDTTIIEISQRAGVSSGLAHHYFGSKDNILFETMRYLLRDLGDSLRRAYANAKSWDERIDAILYASLLDGQMDDAVITTWLNFYVLALSSDDAARLLRIYKARLNSNLVAALNERTDRKNARRIAETASALIDGIWVRRATEAGSNIDPATALKVRDYINLELQVQ